MLTGKYLKYTPEITLEIFTLIYNKLIVNHFKPVHPLMSAWKEFSGKYFYFYCYIPNKPNQFESINLERFSKTTVQEILGYDPFMKETIEEPKEKNWSKATKEELLEEAKRRYPIGTKIIDNENSKKVYVVEKIPFFYWDRCIAGCSQGGVIYWDNKWSEIISLPVTDKEFSVGTYIVFLQDYGRSKKGDVDEIIESDDVLILRSEGVSTNEKDWIKWFATKAEAEEFAKTLIEPVKNEVKQPLKQAVHCTNQEEWDFVQNKVGNDSENWFADKNWGNNRSFCVSFEGKNQSQTLKFYQDAGYQILSFQEWCQQNGYLMENKCEFIVGKWYKMNDCWYLKYKGKDIVNTDKIYMSESIDSTFNHKYDNGFVAYLHEQKTWRLASIEEIQQYLPDGHPDKIKSNQKFKVGEYIILENAGGWSYSSCNDGCLGLITKIGNYIPHSLKNCTHSVTGKILNSNNNDKTFKDIPVGIYEDKIIVRYATPEEINQHLISIGQIPAGEPLNTGLEPNKDGMFKYTTSTGSVFLGNCSTLTDKIPIKPKLILSIDDKELPMVNIIKTNIIKQLLNIE